jgi:hypothetical protein
MDKSKGTVDTSEAFLVKTVGWNKLYEFKIQGQSVIKTSPEGNFNEEKSRIKHGLTLIELWIKHKM